MNAGKAAAFVALSLLGLVAVGALAVWLFHALLSVAFYLIVGAAVVTAGGFLYHRAKRSIGPGSRTRNRLEAAAATYRARNR